jgi:hypothetical protein
MEAEGGRGSSDGHKKFSYESAKAGLIKIKSFSPLGPASRALFENRIG